MPDHGAGLVVFDLDCCRRTLATIIGPCHAARQDILRALQPLETNHGSCGWLWIAGPNGLPSELIDKIAINSRLNLSNATLRRYSRPRVRHFLIECVGVHALHHTPG